MDLRISPLVLFFLCSCGGSQLMANGQPAPLGHLTRAQIVAAEPSFGPDAGAQPGSEAVTRLASAPPGAELTIVLGLWCPDSQRELSRFFRTLDELEGTAPFSTTYVSADRSKESPGNELEGIDVDYVPLFIVVRDGAEIGRIVESAPAGIESDLADLLDGTAGGVISGRTDL